MKYIQVYSNGEPMLFEDDVFKAEIPLSDMSTADKPPIKLQKKAILDFINDNWYISNMKTMHV